MPTVTASFDNFSGRLTVTGDDANNHITITEKLAGQYNVTATDGRGDNIGNPFINVRSIHIDTKGGVGRGGVEDTIDFVGDPAARTVLERELNVTGASLLQIGFGSNFNVAGPVAISQTNSGGHLQVFTGLGGAPNNQENVTLGPTTVSDAGDSTSFQVFGATGNTLAINGNLSLSTAGKLTMLLGQVAIAGGIVETSAGTADSIRINLANIRGFVSLNGSASNSGIKAEIKGTTIGTFFSVASGGGDDTVDVSDTEVEGLGLQPQQQTFGVSLKGGVNTSIIGSEGAKPRNIVHGSLFHFGAGTEKFTLRDYTITSFVTVNAQAGNSGITADINHSKISSFLSFVAAGNLNDGVSIDTLAIGQNFGMDLGGGTNTTIITNSTYLGSYHETDAGIDVVTFARNTGFGDVTFSANTLRIAAGAFFGNQIAGAAVFTSTGSTSADEVNIGLTAGGQDDPASYVTIGKDLKIDVRASRAAAVDIVVLDAVIVKGNVTVDKVTSGSITSVVTILNVWITGNLTLNAGGIGLKENIDLGKSGNVAGTVVVFGNLAITTGSGADTVSCTNTTIHGTANIATAGGKDSVNLEAILDSQTPSQFFGAVNVSTGDGDDILKLGFDALNQARFFSTLAFDGGAGTDTLTETAPQYFLFPPTKTNVP